MKQMRECPVCGEQFFGRTNKKYCSTRCRKAAFDGEELLPDTPEDIAFAIRFLGCQICQVPDPFNCRAGNSNNGPSHRAAGIATG